MASRYGAGPDDRVKDRGPRQFEQLAGRLDLSTSVGEQAHQLVDELIANGADLRFRRPEGAFPASFTYELRAGGDRQRCREIIAEAKGRSLLWSCLLKDIAERSAGAV